MVGNVLGNPGLHTTWSNATMHPTNCSSFPGGTRNAPIVYAVGCDDDQAYTANAWTTLIKHGNYDYLTQGVAHWDGGADHTLKKSMYYTLQPGRGGVRRSLGPRLDQMLADTTMTTRQSEGMTVQHVRFPARHLHLRLHL